MMAWRRIRDWLSKLSVRAYRSSAFSPSADFLCVMRRVSTWLRSMLPFMAAAA
jgi:hypothetical protein